MTDKNLAKKLRAEGMTYQQIGDTFEVSRQDIYRLIGSQRKGTANLIKIRNKKLRTYFENYNISFPSFAKLIDCGSSRAMTAKIYRFIHGDSNTRLTAEQWLNFCNETGLTLAELLEVDKCTA
jgi:transposase